MNLTEDKSRSTGILEILRKRIGPLTVFEESRGEKAGREERNSYVFSLQPLVEAMNPVIEQFGCFARYELHNTSSESNPDRVVTIDQIKIIPHSMNARLHFQKALSDIQEALESSEGKDVVMRELEIYKYYDWFKEVQNAFLAVRARLGEAIR